MDQGRPREAALAYSRIESDTSLLHQKLGLAFLHSGLHSAAERELIQAREADPNDPTPVFWLAELAEERGDSLGARLRWQEYAALRPEAGRQLAAVGSESDRERVESVRERFRRQELQAVLHPERVRGIRLLQAVSARLEEPGLVEGPRSDWDPRVSDAASWIWGGAGLPDFPPPPGQGP